MVCALTVHTLKRGTFEQFREVDYDAQLARVAPFVESVGADEMFGVFEDFSA